MKKLILIAALALSANGAFSQTKAKTTDTAKSPSVTRTASFRVRYDQVFKRNDDGSFSAIQPVQINGETIGSGLPFTRGTTFGGVDVAAHEGHDLLIDTIKSVVIIRKIFWQAKRTDKVGGERVKVKGIAKGIKTNLIQPNQLNQPNNY